MRKLKALALVALGGCTKGETGAVDAARGVDAAGAAALAVVVQDAQPEASTVAVVEPRKYKVVLHTGDSTVGGDHALTGALKKRFVVEGARFVSDTVESASIVSVANDGHLKELVAKHNPDLVLINLGTNEVFVPAPQALAKRIEAIAKRVGARDCIWIGPPTWKPDTGVVNVIREHAAPCRFFDSSDLKLDRIFDGIHPSEVGGEQWAAAFWAFFRGADGGIAGSPR